MWRTYLVNCLQNGASTQEFEVEVLARSGRDAYARLRQQGWLPVSLVRV